MKKASQKTVLSEHTEGQDNTLLRPDIVPVMPLRNAVIFPGQIIPLAVGREKSLAVIRAVDKENKEMLVTAQVEEELEDPHSEELYDVGTMCSILKVLRMPDGTEHVVVQGLRRARILDIVETVPYFQAVVQDIEEHKLAEDNVETDALLHTVQEILGRIVELSPQLSTEHRVLFLNNDAPEKLPELAAIHLNFTLEERQEILSLTDPLKRLQRAHYYINRQLQILEIGSKLQDDVQGELNKTQRKYVLREQLKAIKRELGEDEDSNSDVEELRQRFADGNYPEQVQKVADKELDRLAQMPTAAAEYGVIRTYLEWLLELPWQKSTDDRLDLAEARQILDRDHYGLEKVKDRILEFLAVLHLKNDQKSPILCFVGPPGVGKTSLGQSIASSLHRNYVRIALGGMHDEAEIRGHRRTYVGAMPGRIVQSLKKAGSNNPLFILDEIDKLGRDFRGDPSSALLEVLDPEQNHAFADNYIELEFDLSKTFFIATANVLDTIPAPLRDRMDVIQLSGYTEAEKIQIARRYLVPKQVRAHGLRISQVKFQKAALQAIIAGYTREAGVRNLERRIAEICRKIAREFVEGRYKSRTISARNLAKFLGPEKFSYDVKERTAQSGVATGLAWTPAGGDILFIEASMMPGKGGLRLTGQLGEVMKESANIALSLLRAQAEKLQLAATFLDGLDVHLHVPAGAIPKDGPSAGIAMFTALYSLFSGRRVRNNVAMTGEITLRGQVLPIGGVKEKVLAAKRAGIDRVLLPGKNRSDFEEIPVNQRQGISVRYVDNYDEVIKASLLKS
jgi:ATP-dependent Lon protease